MPACLETRRSRKLTKVTAPEAKSGSGVTAAEQAKARGQVFRIQLQPR
jgi:hypothetical protein